MTREDTIQRLQEARTASTRYPWERQFNESRKAFDAFCIYRDMGPTRSAQKVARELSKSEPLIRRWSAKWNWVERVAEWGDEQDRQNRITQAQSIQKMNERHAALAVALTGKIVKGLNLLQDETIKGMTPSAMSRLLEVGVKVERQARGEAGEVVEEKVEATSHLEHLTTEELEQLDRIHDNAAERAERDQD
tara:strand:- start:3908 stop:4483 length:576 start_codon:yes stop_codon:yes gene_type:complete